MRQGYGRSAASGRRAEGQQQALQEIQSDVDAMRAIQTAVENMTLAELLDSAAETCTAGATIKMLPPGMLTELQRALTEPAPGKPDFCTEGLYTSVAQLLRLAAQDWVGMGAQAGREAVRGFVIGIHLVLAGTEARRAPARPGQAPSTVKGHLLLARLLCSTQLPQLYARQLAAVRRQLGSRSCHSVGVTPLPAGSLRQQAAGPAAPVPSQQGNTLARRSASSAGAVALAVDLCSTQLLSLHTMLPADRSPAGIKAARRTFGTLSHSQLLDHLAHTVLSIGASSSSITSSSSPAGTALSPGTPATAGQPQQQCGQAPAASPVPHADDDSPYCSSIYTSAGRMDMTLSLVGWTALSAFEGRTRRLTDPSQDPAAATLEFLRLGHLNHPLVQAVLDAPGLQYYAAARMVQALCAVDGGARWGMPELGLPLTDAVAWAVTDGSRTVEERALAFMLIAGKTLMVGMCKPRLRTGPTATPVQPGGVFRIAMRSLELVIKGPGPAPTAVAAAAAAAPADAPRRPYTSIHALHVAHHALPLALVALRAAAPSKAERRLLQLLPFAVAALDSACDKDVRRDPEVVHKVITTVMRVLLNAVCDYEDSSYNWLSPAASVLMPPVLDSGLLQALQAAAAWLTPEHIAADARPYTETSLAQLLLLIDWGIGTWPRLAAPPPAAQLAALVVSVRSAFTGFVACYQSGPAGMPIPGGGDLLCAATCQLQYALTLLLCGPARDASQPIPGSMLPALTFALVQWGPCLQRAGMAVIAIAADLGQLGELGDLLSLALMPISVAAEIYAQIAAAGPGDEGGGAGAAASRAARLASWRCFLLRDLRAMDTLGLLLQFAASHDQKLNNDNVSLMLQALQVVARTLPQDMRQHLQAAARAQPMHPVARAADAYVQGPPGASSRSIDPPNVQPFAAGIGWLRGLDERAVPLLAEGRFDAVELPGLLKGRTLAEVLNAVEPLLLRPPISAVAALLPAPCEVADLLPTCDNPHCTAQACYFAAGRRAGRSSGNTTMAGAVSAMSRCSKCKQVCYCSRACQKAHWDEYHKVECGKGWWDPVVR